MINDFLNKKILKTNSFETYRDWTYLQDIPYAIHNIIKENRKFKILNLVSPYILKDKDIMMLIAKDKNMLKSKNLQTIHNASYSIYLKKIKFKNWTSPHKVINLIKKKNYEKN